MRPYVMSNKTGFIKNPSSESPSKQGSTSNHLPSNSQKPLCINGLKMSGVYQEDLHSSNISKSIGFWGQRCLTFPARLSCHLKHTHIILWHTGRVSREDYRGFQLFSVLWWKTPSSEPLTGSERMRKLKKIWWKVLKSLLFLSLKCTIFNGKIF